MQTSDNVGCAAILPRILRKRLRALCEMFLREGDVSPRCNSFERYFINGGWNRQRGQKLTCYIVRTIHWTGRNTQHEPRNCADLHSECTRAMRSLTAIVVPRELYRARKNKSASGAFPALSIIRRIKLKILSNRAQFLTVVRQLAASDTRGARDK